MRFLHTADWHLGRLFHQVHLTEDQAFVLRQLIDIARGARVDAIVVAGDVYDRAVPPPEARIWSGAGMPAATMASRPSRSP